MTNPYQPKIIFQPSEVQGLFCNLSQGARTVARIVAPGSDVRDRETWINRVINGLSALENLAHRAQVHFKHHGMPHSHFEPLREAAHELHAAALVASRRRDCDFWIGLADQVEALRVRWHEALELACGWQPPARPQVKMNPEMLRRANELHRLENY